MTQLNPNFLNELIRSLVTHPRVLVVCLTELKFEYMPSRQYKEIWNFISSHHRKYQQPPTIGHLFQGLAVDPETIAVLEHVKMANLPAPDVVLDQLEVFIKQKKFSESFALAREAFNKGDHDLAYSTYEKNAIEIAQYSLSGKNVETVFGGYNERDQKRQQVDNSKRMGKVPFRIDDLDDVSYGGVNYGDTCCFLAQSGVGKSKLLKWIAMQNAVAGISGVHIQAEGTHAECMTLYDAMWTSNPVKNLERGTMPEGLYEQLQQAIQYYVAQKSDIHVYSFEQFGSGSMIDVRNIIADLIREFDIQFICLDYLEKMNTGGKHRYGSNDDSTERTRRLQLAMAFKDLCVEFNLAGFTATQASTIAPDVWNQESFVMTRYNTSEAKSLVDPFSYFISLNQTTEEKKMDRLRLHCDKIRKYKSGWTIPIKTAYDYEWFYHRDATINEGMIGMHRVVKADKT